VANVFRAKMLDAFSNKKIRLPKQYPKDWVVNCKHVGKGKKALLYPGQYLYRGVIKEKDILSSRNGMVTFRFINSKKLIRIIQWIFRICIKVQTKPRKSIACPCCGAPMQIIALALPVGFRLPWLKQA